MVSTSKKRGRTSPYALSIIGGPSRFIKDEVEISFRPEPKKYSSCHLEKEWRTDPSFLLSTTTASTTPPLLGFPPSSLKRTRRS